MQNWKMLHLWQGLAYDARGLEGDNVDHLVVTCKHASISPSSYYAHKGLLYHSECLKHLMFIKFSCDKHITMPSRVSAGKPLTSFLQRMNTVNTLYVWKNTCFYNEWNKKWKVKVDVY